MGLGKTIEALAAIVHNWSINHGGHYLVVVPAGLTANWIREIQNRTSIPDHLLRGPDRHSLVTQWLSKGGIAVISYNTLIGTPLAAWLRAINRKIDILISDEAHYVKNPDAQRTASVKDLATMAKVVCLMSGTPMENHPGEFCDLIDVARPGEGQSLKQETVVADLLFNNSSRFHARVAGIYLRRNQEDVLRELPEKIEIPEWVDLEDGDLIAYRNAVCQGNFMAMRKTATIGLGDGASSKINRLHDLLDDHRGSGRKVVIFSFFLEVLSLLESQMNVLGAITGSMDARERLRLVDTFREQPNHQILLAQIEAGGQGLNLQAASVVVLMEPQFKPTTEDQAVARAHRMGQSRRVIVHRLLARDCVDERLVRRLSRKKELFELYARESLIKHVSDQATESRLIKEIVAEEQRRLGVLSKEAALDQ